MDLNYTAFLLISFVPLIMAIAYYHPKAPFASWLKISNHVSLKLSLGKCVLLFLMSFSLVYGYINLVIHQMGFYELFFTDIMIGSQEAEQVVADFMSKYGDKHRHFGHGVFHGAINAFVFLIPFLGMYSIVENKSFRFFLYHFIYWLLMSMITCGLISAFV